MSKDTTPDYKVVSSLTRWGMNSQARRLMAQGYMPCGGISASFGILYQSFSK